MGLSTVLRVVLTSLSQITGKIPGFTRGARCGLFVKSITFLSKSRSPGPKTLCRTTRLTLSSISTGASNRALRARRTVVRCGCRFYLRIILKLGHCHMNNNKTRNIPAATLAFLTKSAKAMGNLFSSSAHDTPGPNQPLASIMAVS